ncbi:hypothetical protein VIGAN_07245400 [Vigna angularis var. angularis]|uniref:RRM domain-containing protein n=1 Tax=Vigna angularis var. angularis TaxID=157739 RepID=A0A0S3SKZ4_PHAAN|nr:hypothetical protein VIGAN_07245400 [Vigna angularis var. angularis]
MLLHAFVEYESIELAERAVAELNDEGNWRSGLWVRLMHRRMVCIKIFLSSITCIQVSLNYGLHIQSRGLLGTLLTHYPVG